MSTQGTIKRYYLELEFINKRPYPTLKEIKNYLEKNDFDISSRTVQRDIEAIRWEFGIKIIYDTERRGYCIDKENILDVERFLRFLEPAYTAELFKDSLKDVKDTIRYISFEATGALKGVKYLKPLLRAIKEHRKVKLLHKKFQTEKYRKVVLKPYLLREYRNRWYVVGKIGDVHKYWHYGLDRIQDLEVLTGTFEPDPDFRPAEIYDHIIGVSYHSGRKPEKVVLEFTENQGEYVKTLPLHPSQEILKDYKNSNPSFEAVETVTGEKEGLYIALYVIPNYELEEQILQHGEKVKVLEPQWLADRIKQRLKEALGRYE